MDRKTLLAVALSVLVLGLWQIFFAPRAPQPRPSPPAPHQTEAGPRETPAEPAAPPVPVTPAEPIAAAEAQEFILETDAYSLRFTNQGGRILSWRLLKYTDDLQAPLELIPRDLEGRGDFPLRIGIPGDEAATESLAKALFRHEVSRSAGGVDWPGGEFKGSVVTFTYGDAGGLVAVKRLAVPDAGYVGHASVEVTRGAAAVPFEFTWAVGLPEPSDDQTSRYFHAQGQGVAYVGGRAQRFVAKDLAAPVHLAGAPGAGAYQWGGLESTYFASLLLPDRTDTAAMSLVPLPAPAGQEAGTALLAARYAGNGTAGFRTVVGPKDYNLLTSLDRELDRAIDFSRYSLIYVVTKYLFLALRWLNGYVGNYGLAIVLLTIAIRAAFFPFTYRSAITMRQNAKKMQRIQPRVKAIQERYRKMKRSMETQRQMNEEIMGLYRKEGLNPMGSLGGCLPLLLQMPVFIAFYNLLSVTIELRGAPFLLWIRDLSRMDPYYVTPILMGVSWWVQQWMTSSSIPDPMQRRMLSAMPIIFTFMMARMPSGLVVYWLVSNVVGLAQQWVINREADKAPAGA